MPSGPAADRDLRDLLASSEAVGIALLDAVTGVVESPSPTFTRLTGILPGDRLADAVAEPQRAVLAQLIDAADDLWCRVVLSFDADGTSVATDRALSILASGGKRWLAVERNEIPEDRVHERLLAMTEDLADAYRLITAQNDELQGRTVELAGVIDELRSSRLVIRKLEGLLPVCAWCRRVRDDDDLRWIGLEEYLASRQAVSITHSVCPECAAEVRRADGR